jgi:predicted nuclease with TOPRIM domain
MNPDRLHKSTKGIYKTMPNTEPMSSLNKKLKSADPEIQKYAIELAKENSKLQRQIGKCQAEIVSLRNRIKVLEDEFKTKDKWEKERMGGDIKIEPSGNHKKISFKL